MNNIKIKNLIKKLEHKLQLLGSKIKKALRRTALNLIFKIEQLKQILEATMNKTENNAKKCFNNFFPTRKIGKLKIGYFLINNENEPVMWFDSARQAEAFAKRSKKIKAIISFSVPVDYKLETFYEEGGEIKKLKLSNNFIKEYLFDWINNSLIF